ncbi:MAG: sel1 repeat family protein [Magnetococcales bacterium]|nr:sel1 repeat family protein [Magnetococcales bacterium]NGZ26927.1 sel1 repeat family protein [Magnetococcales bacterium]
MKNLDVAHLVTGVTTEDDFDMAVAAYENGDFPSAAKLFQKLAEGGDQEAQINLARMILDGKAPGMDRQVAVDLLKKAEANGSDDAKDMLAGLN